MFTSGGCPEVVCLSALRLMSTSLRTASLLGSKALLGPELFCIFSR